MSLEGSPALVQADAKAYGQQQVDAITNQGMARRALAYGGADITENKGRAALIGGYINAASSLVGAGGKAYSAGALDSGGTGGGTTMPTGGVVDSTDYVFAK